VSEPRRTIKAVERVSDSTARNRRRGIDLHG
jgi:hypothetical protein